MSLSHYIACGHVLYTHSLKRTTLIENIEKSVGLFSIAKILVCRKLKSKTIEQQKSNASDIVGFSSGKQDSGDQFGMAGHKQLPFCANNLFCRLAAYIEVSDKHILFAFQMPVVLHRHTQVLMQFYRLSSATYSSSFNISNLLSILHRLHTSSESERKRGSWQQKKLHWIH